MRRHLFAGIVITAPIFATFWLLWKFLSFVDDRVRPLIPARWNPETHLPIAVPGLGLAIAVLMLTLVGLLARGVAGRVLARAGDDLLARVPFLGGVYGWTKQIFETVLAERSPAFRRVVMVEFPRPGVWAVGLVTGPAMGEVQDSVPDPLINVFVPATPNVTTGFLLFLPESDLRPLNISVEEGLKLVVSGGIVVPAGNHHGLVVAGESAPEPPPPTETKATSRSRLSRCFFTGLLVTGPIGLTLWLAWTVIGFVDVRVVALLPERWRQVTELPFVFPGLGLVLVVSALIVIGLFATGLAGRTVIRIVESALRRMPVINSIYTAFKQIFETALGRRSRSFRQVVLLEYPRPRSWAMGFVTGRTLMPTRRFGGAEPESPEERKVAVNVFLPTTPNPTSGFLLFLPESEVKVLGMTVEQGLKLVVSGGLVVPPRPGHVVLPTESREPEAGAELPHPESEVVH